MIDTLDTVLLVSSNANNSSKASSSNFRINFIRNGKAYYADSMDKTLFYSIHKLNHFPINFKITRYDWRIYTKCRKEKVKSQT